MAALEAQLVERAQATAAAEALAASRDAEHRLEQEAIELRGTSDALAAARRELEETRAQAEALQGELSDAEQKAQTAAVGAERAAELEAQLEETRTQAEALRSELVESEKRAQTAAADAERAAELEAQLEETRTQAETLRSELAESSRRRRRQRPMRSAQPSSRRNWRSAHAGRDVASELAESEQKAQANAADAERAAELERELEDGRATLADARVKLDEARAQRSRVPELEAELAARLPRCPSAPDEIEALRTELTRATELAARGRARATAFAGADGAIASPGVAEREGALVAAQAQAASAQAQLDDVEARAGEHSPSWHSCVRRSTRATPSSRAARRERFGARLRAGLEAADRLRGGARAG